jgi:hypothetical protein
VLPLDGEENSTSVNQAAPADEFLDCDLDSNLYRIYLRPWIT